MFSGMVLAQGNNSLVNPDRYTLCTSEAEIRILQQTYDLIVVTSSPTDAAMHPSWPETAHGITMAIYARVQLATASGTSPSPVTVGTLIIPAIVDIAWTIGFGVMESRKTYGGWVSLLNGSTTVILMNWAMEIGNVGVAMFLLLFAVFQGGAIPVRQISLLCTLFVKSTFVGQAHL